MTGIISAASCTWVWTFSTSQLKSVIRARTISPPVLAEIIPSFLNSSSKPIKHFRPASVASTCEVMSRNSSQMAEILPSPICRSAFLATWITFSVAAGARIACSNGPVLSCCELSAVDNSRCILVTDSSSCRSKNSNMDLSNTLPRTIMMRSHATSLRLRVLQ